MSRTEEHEDIFETAKEYIRDNHHADIRLDEFCVLMGYSDRTVQRALKEFGTTWRYLLTRVRLIFAAEHLMYGDEAIAVVSKNVGYKSLTNFNRSFKKFWGKSPNEFRKQYR